jgi:PIN domain nuclease of toxin-antitoxin system
VDLLPDTHVFLWWDAGLPRLAEAARRVIAAPSSRVRVHVSDASASSPSPARRSARFAPTVSWTRRSRAPTARRPATSRGLTPDPFDRLIIAQARARGMTLVTADATMQTFMGVAVIPAG